MTSTDLIAEHFRLNAAAERGLNKLRLQTISDMLHHFPARYRAPTVERTISQLIVGEEVTIYGRVEHSKISRAWRKKIPMGEITLVDTTGKIKAVWFHQPYLAKKVPEGALARLQGKVAERNGQLYLANPEIEPTDSVNSSESLFSDGQYHQLIPIYPETRGLSSLWFYHAIKKILREQVHEQIDDPLPAEMLKRYHLPPLATALVWLHSPKKEADAAAARKRFAFQEIFFIQIARLQSRREYQSQAAFKIKPDPSTIRDFAARLPFPLTNAQKKAINDISRDFALAKPMARLLEGDVGSGKTAVAAATAVAAVHAGLEVAYMAPTEILARQHFESFINYFRHLNINVGLITGTECRKFPSKINLSGHAHISRPQLLKWVANGEIPIVIGTHALITKQVKFKNLAYVIIDEQHRFGVMQRSKLVRKESRVPHLLSMTATPIPRTLALTIYGDLDLTLLDELPAGRKQVFTEIIPEDKRAGAYEKIREELKAGRQAFIICPRIDEPDPSKDLALNAKSAKTEQKRLQTKIFPEFTIGLVHSKMKPKNKEGVMAEFASGQIQILVATSVVEVGVNVPNATIIVIEGAERFGLAQLHQLRGRVLRSSHQAYCYLFSDSTSGKTKNRLDALRTAKNGFELAELDLQLRGAGSLTGAQQWGLSDLGMEAIKNLKMVEAARTEAQNLLATDPNLKNYPKIKARLATQKSEVHFE